MIEIIKKLCVEKGVSGREYEMLDTIKELVGDMADVRITNSGSIIAQTGNKNSDKHIMLDAHIDRIGMVVTYIDDNGFIKAEPVGGVDLRTLPGSVVRVYGKEPLTGVICTIPPHLSNGEEKPDRDRIWIDTGLTQDKIKETVLPGDSVVVCGGLRELMGRRVSAAALDNRAGCAALVRCMQLLDGKDIPCRLSVVFSSQEETNEMGAGTAAYELEPDEAVVVDVGFADQNGVPKEKSGKLGCGAIISISPVLSKSVTNKIIEICKKMGTECDYEVCGGSTGTNADRIAVSRSGVKTGCISIPEKNMHTQTETVLLDDIEKVAQILACYVSEGGAGNA